MIGDVAHLMSPFSGEGVKLALVDAVDLAEALASTNPGAVRVFEGKMATRAEEAAGGAAAGRDSALSPEGVAPVFEHYRRRSAT